ncbi:MAG TPA: prepilin-type N-terminal cleavage/methylation domain-containing protein [Solirubrobacteraceae bacterium]|nr:prepilin-type N-terminal cleavage/methylation domain-containing protein [Solirubrobacteraceae bacterium]
MASLRLKRQDGFTIIEVLVGVLILAVGILSTLAVFSDARKLSLTAEHKTTMGQRAQSELERVLALPWNQVALTGSSSGWSTNPSDYTYVSASPGACPANASGPAPTYQPDHAVGGSSNTESLVINGCSYTNTVSGSSQTVTPSQGTLAPVQTWSAPLRDGTTITGQVYDFITWTADPTCSQTATPGSTCSTTNDYKRVTVVVTMTGAHPANPAIYAEYVTPPNSGHPPNSATGTTCTQGTQTVSCTNTPPPGQVPTPSYQLCDTSASNSSCTEPTSCAGNILDNTVTGVGAVSDLLGTSQPTADCTSGTPPVPTPPCFATNLGCGTGVSGGGNVPPGGLPIQPTSGSTCTTPPADNTKAHSWVTPAIAAGSTWNLTGTGTMTSYFESGTATPVNATLCMALYVLPSGLGGTLLGTQIGGTFSASVSASAGVPTPATFDFNVGSGTYALASTGAARIEVVVWIVNSSSAVDLVYDQSQFASQITFLLQT